MKNFISKFSHYILLAVIVLAFGILGAFGLGNSNAPSTYYQTNTIAGSNGTDNNAFVYQLNYNEGVTLNSVYINFGGQDYSTDKNVTVTTVLGKEENSYFSKKLEKVYNNNFSDLKIGGWTRLLSKEEIGSGYTNHQFLVLAFDTGTSVKVNEIVFVGENQNKELQVVSATCVRGGIAKALTGSLNTMKISKNSVEEGKLLIDEQSKFDVNRVTDNGYTIDENSRLTEAEGVIAEGLKNLFTGNAYLVDVNANPLGSYILGIGTSIFGYTPLGLRIMPFLFTLASIVTLFFIGKLITKKDMCGVLLAFVFAVCGFSLSFATFGSVTAILVFFTTLCLYFLLRFYKYGFNKDKPLFSHLNLLLAGLSFAISINIKSQAIYLLFGIIAILIVSFIKHYKDMLLKDKKASLQLEQNEKENKPIKKFFIANIPALVVAVLSLVILPILLTVVMFLVSYETMSVAYESTSLFTYMFAHLKAGLLTKSSVGFADWLLSLACVDLGGKFILSNLMVSLISLIATVGAIIMVVMYFVKKPAKKGYTFRFFVLPFIAVLVGFLGAFVIDAILSGLADGYYMAYVFMLIGVILLFNYANKFNTKVLFKAFGQEITVTKLITAILIVISIVYFVFLCPAVLNGGAQGLIKLNALKF